MNFRRLSRGAASLFALWSATASANGVPDVYDGEVNVVCLSTDRVDRSTYYFLGRGPSDTAGYLWRQWEDFVALKGLVAENPVCQSYRKLADAERWVRDYSRSPERRLEGFEPDWSRINPHYHRWLTARRGKIDRPEQARDTSKSDIKQARSEAEKAPPAKTRADYEADWQAKLQRYDAEKAAWQAKIAAQKAEDERKQAAHTAAQEAAAREKAAYEEKLAAHRRELDEANRRQQAYFEAQRRHALCVNGDRKWCAQPAAAETKMADAGKASTDTDATRCVTNPEVFPSRVWKNTIEARVVNNCETSVDIVICLNRPEGWHCGVKMGVSPGGRMSWDARNGNGQVYWDARVMGRTKPLGRPN